MRANTDNSCKAAGGFLLQLLPGADESIIPVLEKNIASLGSVSKLLEVGRTPEEIIAMVLEGIDYDLFDSYEIEYQCTCNRDKYMRALISLNQADMDELAESGEPVETECRFCHTKYSFDIDEILKARKE